ncbi:MAG: hypothetical protein H0X17_01640 [Deltaproteobacteria bacterium]|nr:hypothetical protein [Deltaproteobacteria bacterium]
MMTTRVWYLLAAGMIASAVIMAALAFGQMVSTVEGMQRVVMPGRAEITLPIGRSTIYAEQESVVAGKAYIVSEAFPYRCGIDEQQKRAAVFKPASSKVTYSVGDFTGHNAWDLDITTAGTYTLVCEGDQPFVLAVGRGIGAWIVVGVVGLVPFIGGVAVIALVYLKRRRQRRQGTPSTTATSRHLTPRLP